MQYWFIYLIHCFSFETIFCIFTGKDFLVSQEFIILFMKIAPKNCLYYEVYKEKM